jgi:hypothetical protein
MLDNQTGWMIVWEDGKRELIVAWAPDGDGHLMPYVVDTDNKTVVPADERGDYTLEHPNQHTRAAWPS